MDRSEELRTMGMIRKALAPLLKEEIIKAVGEAVATQTASQLEPILEKVLSNEKVLQKALSSALGNINVTVDTSSLDKRIQDFLEKRDTHITYEPNIEVTVPGLSKVAETLAKATSISDYRPHDQDSVDESIYDFFGFVHPSGAWYIMRSSASDQRYTAGFNKYDAAWEDRKKQSYGLIDEAFNG